MKYIVADGASFLANGRVYGPGEAIDESVFGKEALALALKPSERFPNGKLLDKAKVDAEFKAAQDKIQREADKLKKEHETKAAQEAADRKLTLAKAQAATKTKAAEKAQETADVKKSESEQAGMLVDQTKKEADAKADLLKGAQDTANRAALALEKNPQDKQAQEAVQKADQSVQAAKTVLDAAIEVFNNATADATEKGKAYKAAQEAADNLKADADKAIKDAAK